MNFTKYFFIIIACFMYKQTTFAKGLITLHLKAYPSIINEEYCSHVHNRIKRPGKLAEYCLFGILDQRLVAGVFATYAGFLNVSDELGTLTFPYDHNKPSIKLLVSDRLTPIFMADNTIHHWELDPGTHAKMYSMERKLDEDLKLYYWDTKPIELPQNMRIPIDSLIVVAKPENIEVPIGASDTNESPHLILPDIYVKKGNNLITHALYALNLKHLFRPVRFQFKKEPQRYIKQLDA